MDRQKTEKEQLKQRKSEHIDICLREDVGGERISTGLKAFRFVHNALPELNFSDIDMSSVFLNKPTKTPFLISSMTGGTMRAGAINRRLAEFAEHRGWSMGVGSMRTAFEHQDTAETFDVRKYAPNILLFANLGAVQLNYGYTEEHCRRAVELLQADALILHLNSMQEVFQLEGNTDFSGLLGKIEKLCAALEVPIGVKEVGWGISGRLARKLLDAGVSFIDVAGAGGTSWIKVEQFRSGDAMRIKAADAFAGWGIPTAQCIKEVRQSDASAPLIASGGIADGVDAAKCIALGADMVGIGRSMLESASASDEKLDDLMRRIEFEFRAAMFGTGSGTLRELKNSPLVRHDLFMP